MSSPMTFRDIVVAPTTDIRGWPYTVECRAGPIWPEWEAQRLARHCHGREPAPFDAEPAMPARIAETIGEAIWCGPICGHFGHQVADFSMRMVEAAHLTELPLLFTRNSAFPGSIPGFFWAILDRFAVPRDRVRIAQDGARVATLHVLPQAERQFAVPPSKDYLALLERVCVPASAEDVAGRAVFVSRSRIEPVARKGCIAGEAYLDQALAAAGVVVIHPERLPLPRQLGVYASAGKLLFSEGSAVHGLQLGGRIGAEVFVLARRPRYRLGRSCLVARTPRLDYLEPGTVLVHGQRRDGGEARSAGITILDAPQLRMAIGGALGVNLDAVWDQSAYEAAIRADLRLWLAHWAQVRYRFKLGDTDTGMVCTALRAVPWLADVAAEVEAAWARR